MDNSIIKNDKIFHEKSKIVQLGDIRQILIKLNDLKFNLVSFNNNICFFESLEDIKYLSNLKYQFLNTEIKFTNINNDYFKFNLIENKVSQFLELKIPDYINNNLEKELYFAIYPNILFEMKDDIIIAVYMIVLDFKNSNNKNDSDSNYGIIKLENK